MRFLIAAYCFALASFVGIIVAGSVVLLSGDDADGAEAVAGERGFNVVTWELRHLPEKWLFKVGDFVVGHSDGDDDAVIEEYFALVAEIRRLDGEDPESARIEEAEEERADLENRVEDIIEGRVTAVLEDEGLTMGPPPFTDMDLIFPPVDFEFDSPPRVLATSPRDRIALEHDYLLESGVERSDVDEIEAEAEDDGETSAIVVQSGGVATYPSIIANNRSYEGIVDTVFHEWLHQYLVFYPLGSRYFQGSQLRTLNESVANIGGDELGRLYFERWPLLEPEPAPEATPETEPPPEVEEEPFDFTTAMRALRVEVEALLAEGKVEEAEALMDAKRDEFEEKGVFVRRINQAYFAFGGFYADTPASIDPIGPKLAEVFEGSGSPGEFVRRVRGIESVGDLDVLVGD